MRTISPEELRNILESHKKWLAGEGGERADLIGTDLKLAYLRNADLRGAKLRGAYLSGADLRGAYLDFSCWPLWCGSLDVKVDAKIAAQIAYHFCRLDCEDSGYKQARNAILDFANQFHRVEECGKLEKE